MVRLITSIAAVTILAGTALAQGVYYDEQFERSVSNSENLEARSEAVLGDSLAARDFDDLEEYEARDVEELEEREPISFGAVRHGAGFVGKMFRKHHGHHLRKGADAASQQQQDPSQNDRRSDAEDLFEREDEELFGRDYDDVEFEARDFEDLEEREPISFGAVRHGAGFVGKMFRKHGHHLRKGANAASQLQQDPSQNDRRSDAEDLFEREDEELFGRDYEDVEFEARDFEDLEEREPINFGAVKQGLRLAHKAYKKHGHSISKGVDVATQIQAANQNNRRSDAEDLFEREDLEMREFDEDFEDVLARDYNNFDELD